jgi:hypothetical protein
MAIATSTVVDVLAAIHGQKKDIERKLAEFGLGIVDAMEASHITPEQAERDLFNLDVYNAAKSRGLHKDFIRLLEWGMELEDVVEMAPDDLPTSYQNIKKLARRIIGRS